MILEIAKLTGGIMAVLVALLWVVVVFKRHLKSSSTTLFTEGYILTHPERKAIAFDNATDAKYYFMLCRDAGIDLRCHQVLNGSIVLCVWK